MVKKKEKKEIVHVEPEDIKVEEAVKEKEVKKAPTPSLESVVSKLVDRYWKGQESALRSRIILLELTVERLRKLLDKYGVKE